MSNGISALTQAWLQGQQNQQNYAVSAIRPQIPDPKLTEDSKKNIASDGKSEMPALQNMPANFPFCFGEPFLAFSH